MYELLRVFWLPLGLTAAIFARTPFGLSRLGEDPAFPLGDYWIYTLAALAVGLIVIDAAIVAAPLAGVLAGRFGYLASG